MHLVLTSYEGSSLPRMCKHTLHRTPDKEYNITAIIQLPILNKVISFYRNCCALSAGK